METEIKKLNSKKIDILVFAQKILKIFFQMPYESLSNSTNNFLSFCCHIISFTVASISACAIVYQVNQNTKNSSLYTMEINVFFYPGMFINFFQLTRQNILDVFFFESFYMTKYHTSVKSS